MKELGAHSTDLQRSKVQERANGLQRKFNAWVAVQSVYMPTVGPYRRKHDLVGTLSGTSATIHDVRFFLPSEATGLVAFDSSLAVYEFRYRIAQAYETLTELRGLLLVRSQLMNSKARLSYGTKMSTRSQALIQNVSTKISSVADKYRHTYAAILALRSLAGESASLSTAFRPLAINDVTGLKSMEDGSEGYKSLSWIWHVPGIGETESEATENGMVSSACCATFADVASSSSRVLSSPRSGASLAGRMLSSCRGDA